jgi:hypothetical protein
MAHGNFGPSVYRHVGRVDIADILEQGLPSNCIDMIIAIISCDRLVAFLTPHSSELLRNASGK